MSLRLNLCQFAGNAGRDAELKYMASGTPQCQFSIGVNNGYMKDDKWVDQTEWVNVVAWGDLAERVSQYVTKGKGVYVAGKMQTRSWDGDDGAKHYRTEIIANTIQLLDKKEDSGQGNQSRGKQQAKPQGRNQQSKSQALPFEDDQWE